MKILQISIEVNSGSVGRIAEQIGEQIIEQGWSSYITYARKNRDSKSNVIKIGTSLSIMWHGIMTRIFDNHAFESRNATRKLLKDIEKVNPDIIHLHHLHGYFINIDILFKYLQKKRTPVVWTFHDCWSFTGHCTHYSYIGCDKWKTECFKCPQKKEYPKSIIIDRSRLNYQQKKELFNMVPSTIVPASYWLRDEVKKSFLKKHPIKVIENGIDIDVFKPKDNGDEMRALYNLDNKFIILGVASTWSKKKGLEDFISLAQSLPEDMQIILIGLSSTQKLKLPASIVGIERTENVHHLANLYSLADVFVNPTFEETFGLTNIEALACGTPVVTYDSGGSPETITEETGIVVEKENIPELLRAIDEIQRNGKLFYTENCRERAVTFFNKDDRFKDYIQLYKTLLAEQALE